VDLRGDRKRRWVAAPQDRKAGSHKFLLGCLSKRHSID